MAGVIDDETTAPRPGRARFQPRQAHSMHEVLERGDRGSRCSCGYPACPRPAGKDNIPEPLDAGRIGGMPGDADPSRPEENTGLIVAHHPQARHFTL